MANNRTEMCYICGKKNMEVEHLIKGKFGCVCDQCIKDLQEYMNAELEEDKNVGMTMGVK